jgi:predicted nuclease of predicted toxin-antitoxin system
VAKFLIDEDLPRSLAPRLRSSEMQAEDVRDLGLRGCSDEVILQYASSDERILVTGDTGFGNLLRFPLGSHAGVVIARFPTELPVSETNDLIVRALQQLSEEEISGNLVLIEPNRIRLRRRPTG